MVEVGKRFGSYEISSLIGKGGMGEVYLAKDTRLNRKVAVKFLNPELSKSEEHLNRFMREAHAASALNHPNILTVYDIGQTDNTNFIATEFVEGESLSERFAKNKVELSEVLDIGIQIASALVAAHEAGIVHRDIKPENIMIRRDGLVKILDFGLAKLIEKQQAKAEDETKILANTAPGLVLGTPNYMSPEQARGKEADQRTDIWSLGILIYGMLTLRLPFAGETIGDVIAAVLKSEPEPISKFNREVSPELERIVSKSLAKDREERYQTAKDLLVDLKRLRKQIELGAETETPAQGKTKMGLQSEKPTQILNFQKTSVFGSENKRRKIIFAVVSLIIIAGIVGTLAWQFSKREDKSEILSNTDAVTDAPTPVHNLTKLYWQMTEAEQLAFIRERARHIQMLIGDEVTEFDEEALRIIKIEIDHYVTRKDSLSQKQFEEGLRVIYGRATQYAPLVIRAYETRQVPSALGLYQAMIESEYLDCPTHSHPNGPVGMFQFSRRTAAKYGLTPADYCNVEKQSGAAARYMSDIISDFGDGKSNAALGLLSYNIGEGNVRDYLRKLRERGITERSFWMIFRYRQDLDLDLAYLPPPSSLTEGGLQYVPRFFAAAIIGETPKTFDLSTPPLMTLHEKPGQ